MADHDGNPHLRLDRHEQEIRGLQTSMTQLRQDFSSFADQVSGRFEKLDTSLHTEFRNLAEQIKNVQLEHATQIKNVQIENAAHAPTNWWKVLGAAGAISATLAIIAAGFAAWGTTLVSPVQKELAAQGRVDERMLERMRVLELRVERHHGRSEPERIKLE